MKTLQQKAEKFTKWKYILIFFFFFSCRGICPARYGCEPAVADRQNFADIIMKTYPTDKGYPLYTRVYILNFYDKHKEYFNHHRTWMHQRVDLFKRKHFLK